MEKRFLGAKTAGRVYRHFMNLPAPIDPEAQLLQSIRSAREEWTSAERRFNEATNADMVDCASYSLLAAKARYMYLLKEAKEKGVDVS
ncbi:MAG: YaaL family protein [Bacillota bacterium]|nr:YaaL family protein [Bacillota bacterium]